MSPTEYEIMIDHVKFLIAEMHLHPELEPIITEMLKLYSEMLGLSFRS